MVQKSEKTNERQKKEPIRAHFTPIGKSGAKTVHVHFNPSSLQYSITNTLRRQKGGSKKRQYVTGTTGKLSMELIFDTTDTGKDVRTFTKEFERFMDPQKKGKKKGKAPAIVLFEWGKYKFQGMVESYKETIDFFSATGVPLRAMVNLTLANQDQVFQQGGTHKGVNVTKPLYTLPTGKSPFAGGLDDEDLKLPGIENNALDAAPDLSRNSASSVAARAGDPRQAHAIGAANQQNSLRHPNGPGLTVDDPPKVNPPIPLADNGPMAGQMTSDGLDVREGIEDRLGIGTDIGGSPGLISEIGSQSAVGAGAAFSASGTASAGVSAGAGAFAGLHTQPSLGGANSLDIENLLPANESAGLFFDSGASFDLGGKVNGSGPAGLDADVGATASLQDRIQFDDE